MTPGIVIQVLVAGTAGLAIGLAYFTALRRTVRIFVAGTAVAPALGLTALRVGLAVAAFWLIAHWSAAALVAAATGFTLSRLLFRAWGEDD